MDLFFFMASSVKVYHKDQTKERLKGEARLMKELIEKKVHDIERFHLMVSDMAQKVCECRRKEIDRFISAGNIIPDFVG